MVQMRSLRCGLPNKLAPLRHANVCVIPPTSMPAPVFTQHRCPFWRTISHGLGCFPDGTVPACGSALVSLMIVTDVSDGYPQATWPGAYGLAKQGSKMSLPVMHRNASDRVLPSDDTQQYPRVVDAGRIPGARPLGP